MDEFITETAHINDTKTIVFGQFMAQLGDEYLQTAGVEKAVITPQIEQYVACKYHLVALFDKPTQDFRLAMR